MHFKRHHLVSNEQEQLIQKNSQQNPRKQPINFNKNSLSLKSYFPNNQKFHKFQLKALSAVNNYLQRSSSNPQFSSNRKNIQKQETLKKKHFSNIKHIKLRPYSLPIKNNIEVKKDNLKKNHLKHQEIKENKKPRKVDDKKKHSITSSTNLAKKFTLQQKIITERLSENNCIEKQGSIKPINPIKIKWRQLNKLETRSTRPGESLQLFNKRMITNYQLARQRVQTKIMKSQQHLRAKSENLQSNLLQTSKTKQSQNYNLQLSKGRITPNKNFPFIKNHNKNSNQNKKLLIDFAKQDHRQNKLFRKNSFHQQSTRKKLKIIKSSFESSESKKWKKNSPQISRSKLQINSRKLLLFPKRSKVIENQHKKRLCL